MLTTITEKWDNSAGYPKDKAGTRPTNTVVNTMPVI